METRRSIIFDFLQPLSNEATSQWNTYFRDNDVLSQIIKDVRRLYPDISFFQQKVIRRFPSRGDDCDIIGRTITTNAPSVDIVQNAFGAVKLQDSGRKSNSYNFDDDCDLECLASDEEYNWYDYELDQSENLFIV